MPVIPEHTTSNVFHQDRRRRKSIPNALNNNAFRQNTNVTSNKDVRAPSGGYKPRLERQLTGKNVNVETRDQALSQDLGTLSVADADEIRDAPIVPNMTAMESSTFGRDDMMAEELENFVSAASQIHENPAFTPQNTQNTQAPVMGAMSDTFGAELEERLHTMAGARATPGLFMSRSPSVLGRREPNADAYFNLTKRQDRFASEEGEIVEDEVQEDVRSAAAAAAETRAVQQTSPQPEPTSTPNNWPQVPEFGVREGLYFSKDQRPRANPAHAPTTPTRSAQERPASNGPASNGPTSSGPVHTGPSRPPDPEPSTVQTSASWNRPRPTYPSLEQDSQHLSQAAKAYQAAALRSFERQESKDPDFAAETPREDDDDEDSDSETISGDNDILEIDAVPPRAQFASPTTPNSRKRRSESPRATLSSTKKPRPTSPPQPQERLRTWRYDALSRHGKAERKALHRAIKDNWDVDLHQAIPQDLWMLDSQTRAVVDPLNWSSPVFKLLHSLSAVTRGRHELAVAALREVVRGRKGTTRIEFRGDIPAAAQLVVRDEWVEAHEGEDIEVDEPTQDGEDMLADILRRETKNAGRETDPLFSERQDSGREVPIKQEEAVLPVSISRNVVLTQVEAQDVSALDGDAFIRLYGLFEQEMKKRMKRAPAGHFDNPLMID